MEATRLLPSRVVALTIMGILCCLFAVSSASERLEKRFGVPLLFALRNAFAPPAVPEGLYIVTPYKTPSSNQPELLRKWDRRRHAEAIEQLSKLGVTVLAIDIFFRDPHESDEEDERLARALSSFSNTVLVQNVLPHSGGLNIGIIEDPVLNIASAATLLAPSQILGTAVRNDLYALRVPILHKSDVGDCMTSSGQQAHCISDKKETLEVLQPVLSDQDLLYQDPTSAPTLPLATFELWLQSIMGVGMPISRDVKRHLQTREFLTQGISHMHLNLYGPPKTIPTIDYSELDSLVESVMSGRRKNPLTDSVVFLGGSFDDLHYQRPDGFLTVFASNDRLMPGVEMAATAFANLREGNAVIPQTHQRWMVSFTLAILLPLFLFSNPAHTRRSLAIAGASATVLLAFVGYQFANAHVWLPLVTPLITLACATGYIVLSDLRTSNRLKEKARGELGTFVSDLILAQLDGANANQLDQAVCLVTDVRGFTAMSERLSAEALHEFNEHYFSVLFDRVTLHGADVVKTYGDSMTAIWKDAGTVQRRLALQAGRDILIQMNNESANLPLTNIGISSGPVVVGYVGVKQRRSVELTGGAVYRASRLEQLNKSLGTMMLTSVEFNPEAAQIGLNVQDVGSHHLRGFNSPIQVISLEPAASEPAMVENIECTAH